MKDNQQQDLYKLVGLYQKLSSEDKKRFHEKREFFALSLYEQIYTPILSRLVKYIYKTGLNIYDGDKEKIIHSSDFLESIGNYLGNKKNDLKYNTETARFGEIKLKRVYDLAYWERTLQTCLKKARYGTILDQIKNITSLLAYGRISCHTKAIYAFISKEQDLGGKQLVLCFYPNGLSLTLEKLSLDFFHNKNLEVAYFICKEEKDEQEFEAEYTPKVFIEEKDNLIKMYEALNEENKKEFFRRIDFLKLPLYKQSLIRLEKAIRKNLIDDNKVSSDKTSLFYKWAEIDRSMRRHFKDEDAWIEEMNLINSNFKPHQKFKLKNLKKKLLHHYDESIHSPEELMLKTAILGTIIEQIERINWLVRTKKIKLGMKVFAFIDPLIKDELNYSLMLSFRPYKNFISIQMKKVIFDEYYSLADEENVFWLSKI